LGGGGGDLCNKLREIVWTWNVSGNSSPILVEKSEREKPEMEKILLKWILIRLT
jgi:hypothetical protein